MMYDGPVKRTRGGPTISPNSKGKLLAEEACKLQASRAKLATESRKGKSSTDPALQVRYVLMGLDSPSSAPGWDMPEGWNDSETNVARTGKHQGEQY